MNNMAGIVLYNPDLNRLKDNIEAIQNQVSKILFVDNGSNNISEIEAFLTEYKMVTLIKNGENMGIAAALNIILQFAENNGYDWFLTLDQDSVCESGLMAVYEKYKEATIGQITCVIKDRNIGNAYGKELKYNAEFDYEDISDCITSGALNQTKACKEIGGYKDELFIDAVDVDLSYNLRKHGYTVRRINYNGLLHEDGEGTIKKVLFWKFKLTVHAPWRNYYRRRNIIYVARKYLTGMSKVKLIVKSIYWGIGTVLLEDQKIKRLKYNVIGIIDGLKMEI